MTLEEAQVLAKVISTADNGCDNCVTSMCEEMNKAFPDFIFKMTEETWEDHILDWDPDMIRTLPVVSVEPANQEAA